MIKNNYMLNIIATQRFIIKIGYRISSDNKNENKLYINLKISSARKNNKPDWRGRSWD